jgi:hypothetical protein
LTSEKGKTEMRNYRKALCVFVLLLALAAPAFAGEIQHPIAPPEPTTNSATATTATDSDIQTPGRAASTFEADIATGMALNLLESFLSLL